MQTLMASAHRPQKKWGQNFLHNEGAARTIVDSLAPEPGETVFEIGPGKGALTALLVDAGYTVVAAEIDSTLVEKLRERFGGRLTVVEGDALELPLPAEPFRAVGNLPYNVGTPILRRVIAAPACRRAVFMLQKEVADRLVAGPGDEAYGYLTLYCQLYAKARVILTLSPGSFRPSPKVWSAVVSLDPFECPTLSEKKFLKEVLSASFRMRRKQLINNLGAATSLSKQELEGIVREAGLKPDVRAEAMSLSDFDRLTVAIAQRDGGRIHRQGQEQAPEPE